MKDLFEVAVGTVTGRNHSDPLAMKPNQDTFIVRGTDTAIIAVVCDGCSDSRHSEVGANLGACLIAKAFADLAPFFFDVGELTRTSYAVVERVRQDVLAQIRLLANAMGSSFTQTVRDYFLFTTVGVIITPVHTYFFYNGDGVYFINGAMVRLGPYPGNEPPYLAYSLVQSRFEPSQLRFQINHIIPTNTLQSVLVGSDGVVDLIEAEKRKMPGKQELLGPISQFWKQDTYFENPDSLRRRLALANRPVVRLDPESQQLVREKGLLPDDTTLIVIRRKIVREVTDASNP